MTVPAATRAHYRSSWRTLVLTAHAASAATGAVDLRELRDHAIHATRWVTPTADLGETALCAALASVAYAYSRQAHVAERAAMAPALMILAEMTGDLMDRTQPAEPPGRAFRADIDG